MSTLIIIVHVVVAIALILIVLLQTGKGADMGAAFGGGGSQTLFGSGGASTFLSRLTTGVAIVFMLTSLTLAYVSSHRSSTSIMTEMTPPVAEQAGEAVPGVPPQEAQVPSERPVQAEGVPVEGQIPPVSEAGESKPVQESEGKQF
ncbi:MAG: preprotein translocase subunit SecG [Deltaproteobacteria bacterium]|nr:preprotein translocase subunit SecG [Deltaproteobacteria bacterium]